MLARTLLFSLIASASVLAAPVEVKREASPESGYGTYTGYGKVFNLTNA